MAKLGREFEEAVFAFANTLDLKAEVLFDHSIADRDTEEPRQCDVWINAKFGGHWPLSILVSCKDHKRKLHAGDIGTFCDEVRSTRANMGVIYSRSGFTKPALSKAKANSVSCCRIYQNEPADIPPTIYFDQFVCKPCVQLRLHTNLRETKYKTWNDLLGITIDNSDDSKTALDVLVSAFAEGEEWSLSEGKKLWHEKRILFPPDWQQEIQFGENKEENQIGISLMGRWKKYRAGMEATLLNGSYCLSDGSFKGEMVGPTIDTQGDHPGEAWVETTDTELNPQSSRIITILSKGDIRSALIEKLGPTSLY